MRDKFRKMLRSDTFAYFLRYTSIFSFVFLIMTVIILQIMAATLYRTTDEALLQSAEKPEKIILLAQVRSILGPDISEFKIKADPKNENHNPSGSDQILRAPANSNVILFDDEYTIVSDNDSTLGLDGIKPNFSDLNTVREVSVKTTFDRIDDYRYIVTKVSEDEGFENITYAMLLINVSQLKLMNAENKKIVMVVMASFWLISILASVALTVLTIRPIREAYEKQKAFVENASHELRTPLTVLQNRLEALFRKPEATIMDQFEAIASSLDEVRNMRILTTNLLNIARRDGDFQVTIEDIQPEFFETTFDNYSLIADETGKRFVGHNLVRQTIRMDITLLKQVLTILFDNAVKYTEDDGDIYMVSRLRDRQLVITVEDNGIGIADEDKKKIFDRFYRVDKARTRQNGGLGLGLSLAKQIVDRLGGQITIQDRYPKGTVFEVRLPL
ncbi:sensor histidine kinase [Streptococcus rupicaprae]